MGFVNPFLQLFFVVSSCAIIPTSRGRFGNGVRSGRVVVATLSTTTCAKKLRVEIVVVNSVIPAVGGVAVTHRTITIHHIYYLFHFVFFIILLN